MQANHADREIPRKRNRPQVKRRETFGIQGRVVIHTNSRNDPTRQSDDVEGRTKIYESMVKGTNTLEAGTPVSFDVLCNEIRGLGLNIQLEKKKGLGSEQEDEDLM